MLKRKGFDNSKFKKSKNSYNHEEENNDFENELAMMQNGDSDSEVYDTPVFTEETIEDCNVHPKWNREEISSAFIPGQCPLIFQQITIDSCNDFVAERRASANTLIPVVRLYGVTQDGRSVLCNVKGFLPYFYVDSSSTFTDECLRKLQDSLNHLLISEHKNTEESIKIAVISITKVSKFSVFGYRGKDKADFLKIILALPKFMPTCSRILQNGISFASHKQKVFQAYESNIDFETKFMVECDMPGCSWIELPSKKYTLSEKRNSRCQLEVDVFWKNLVCHKPENEWLKIAPFRVLSLDIECEGRKGIFPEPDKDAVIQIANMVIRQGIDKNPFIRTIFTLKSCAAIVGSQVLSFESEVDMLESWSQFFREVDADIITGYNIQNFDFVYLIRRAQHLKCKNFQYLGRVKNIKSFIKDEGFRSKQMGKRDNKRIDIIGRVMFDLLQILLREHKLRSYTLNSVSYHFLEEQKEDVHYSIITDLQNGDSLSRRRLAIYCMKDALLPLRILDKLMYVINYIEMARVTGVPLNFLLTRGQQVKVISMLLRKCKQEDYVIPVVRSEPGDDFTGATVIEPIKGFYNVPISTLDFSSLYPSIIIAHNLCYTTLLNSGTQNLTLNDYTKTPAGNLFVKSHIKEGVLPKILKDLLLARKKAKLDLKNEKNDFKKLVLDGRQLALKISANSVYGFTGAQIGKLPCLEISQSVTAFGRLMIEDTKRLVEEKFSIQNGYSNNAQVIYGDTDSVMIKFGEGSLGDAMRLGREAASYISSTFPHPIKLEFEKVYFPYLLINKKRYAGLYFTKEDKYDKLDCKGIETVRRDNCPLGANLINLCLHKILIERNPEGALEVAKQSISDLLCNRIDISQLVITKELTKKDEEYSGKQAHVELANKMRARDVGSAPGLGDRVPYVIIAAPKNTPAYAKAEDPIYVLEHNIPIDTQYYLDHQLGKPLLRIFEPILGANTESVLLKGAHTLTKTIATSKVGALAAFAKKVETCLLCKTTIRSPNTTHGRAVCVRCKPQEGECYQREVLKLNELEEKFDQLWTQCQRCSGSVHEEVLCTSRDCVIFYMRKKAQIDLLDQCKTINRFA